METSRYSRCVSHIDNSYACSYIFMVRCYFMCLSSDNRLSLVLNDKTCFSCHFPDKVFSLLLPCVFACTCFVHYLSLGLDKLSAIILRLENILLMQILRSLSQFLYYLTIKVNYLLLFLCLCWCSV